MWSKNKALHLTNQVKIGFVTIYKLFVSLVDFFKNVDWIAKLLKDSVPNISQPNFDPLDLDWQINKGWYLFIRVLRWSVHFQSLFSTVLLHMSLQRTWVRAGKVTLTAFVRLFSTVHFQMYPQMDCLRRCKIALAAFVWLLSTVCFQMCPQMACLRRCKVTLVAFVWLFSTVRFQMSP